MNTHKATIEKNCSI